MDATKTYIKVYNITPGEAEDFAFDYDIETDDLLSELVPNFEQWGDIGWMELEEYEYNAPSQTMHLTLNTKWATPTEWLKAASVATSYFHNKLITLATIQKDETCVTGAAFMDGQELQNKYIFEMSSEEVGKYYNDDEVDYDLDELDNKIWDSIGKFTNVCEQFYLGKETEDAET